MFWLCGCELCICHVKPALRLSVCVLQLHSCESKSAQGMVAAAAKVSRM